MKTRTKHLLLTLCAVVLSAVTVYGTYAYFTDSDSATNTFTVGSVGITIDEKDVDNSSAKDRDMENEYHLIPGHSYEKDPTVHVDADSESAWLFVKVDNKIADIESKEVGYVTIARQIVKNGWTELSGVDGVYYQEYEKGKDDLDFIVFESFAIDGNTVTKEILEKYKDATVTITAYAIQLPGFEGKPVEAWSALQTQLAAKS